MVNFSWFRIPTATTGRGFAAELSVLCDGHWSLFQVHGHFLRQLLFDQFAERRRIDSALSGLGENLAEAGAYQFDAGCRQRSLAPAATASPVPRTEVARRRLAGGGRPWPLCWG